MAEKIDELQLGIGSDVTKVLSDLNKLSMALGSAAQKADRLGTSLSSIRGFSDAVKDLSNVNTDNLKKVNSRLRSLSKIDFSNLKDKNINIGMNVNGSGNAMKSISNVNTAMKKVSSGSGLSSGGSLQTNLLNTGLQSLKASMNSVLKASVNLGKQGASALGSFMSKLGLIPSHTANVNKMALTFGNLLRAVLPFYGIRGVFDWLKESVGLGSSIVEIENVIDTAFGSLEKGYEDVSGYIYKWSKTTLDGFGVSELAAMQYAGRLQSIFNSSGFDVTEGMRDSAAKMSTDLIERAGDIASFYDISVDEAMTKMQAGLVGLSRPLRSLGVNLSVANLQQYALNQGITTSWKSMDQATQMALRYNYILDATKYAANDFKDTQMSMANQLRILQLQFQMLSTTIGQGLVSAIAPVISWLNALIKRLIVAANAFKTFMWTLFGKPLGAAKGVADDLLGSLDDSVDATSDLGGGASGASDGLGSAADSAKELKKQLVTLPFDELNQLGKNTDSSSSGGSGGSGGGGGVGGVGDLGDLSLLPDWTEEIDNSPVAEAINKWAKRIRIAFNQQDWAGIGQNVAYMINSGFGKLYEFLDWNNWKDKVYGFINPFQISINNMMYYIDWGVIGRTLARGFNDVVYTLRMTINGFNWRQWGGLIANGMDSMLDEWDADAFGRLIADKFRAAWNFFGGWVEQFNFTQLGTKLKEMILGGLSEMNWSDMGESLGGFLNGISDTINEMLGDGQVRDELADAFSEFVNSFLEEFDEEDAKEALQNIGDTIFGGIWKALKQTDKSEAVGTITTVLSGLPWGGIAAIVGVKAGGALAKGIFGAVFKSNATSIISGLLPGASGATTGATATATASGASTAASAGIGMSAGSVVAGAGIMGVLMELGLAMRAFADGNGGVKQGANLNVDRSFGTTPTAPKATNSAGYSTQIQTQAIKPSAAATNTSTKVTQFVETILTGKKDQSFANLEVAKSSLLDTPIVQKIMNGELTPDFKGAYKKFTDTKLYNVVKTFIGKDNGGFLDKYSKYIYTKAHNVTKWFNGGNGNGFLDKYGKYIYTKAHNVTKWFNGGNGDGFLDKFSKYIYTKTHNVTKKFTGSEGGGFLDKFSKYIYTKTNDVTKKFYGKDAGAFLYYTNKFNNLYDKTIDITFDIITTAKSVVAWVVGKGEEILANIWTRNAKGGLFTHATGFQVFGEAGAEAAIPLERKSTMKRIANAIVDSGGMANGGNAELANEIAMRIAPIVISAINGQNERPVNVNAILYTEDNEVLARAVNRGNRSLDKRYNPVAQYT